MEDFFLKVWSKNMGAQHTWEHIIHGKIWYLMADKINFPYWSQIDGPTGKNLWVVASRLGHEEHF